MEIGKSNLEFKKVSQKIRKQFRLKKKEDLIAQFKQFQENPLIDINIVQE